MTCAAKDQVVRFFFSYASLTWENMPFALPDFVAKLESWLREDVSRDASIYRDKINLKEFQDWEVQLEQAVSDADATIILLSKRWMESEICWKEYIWSLQAPKIGSDRICAIVLDPDRLAESVVPKVYAEHKSSFIERFVTGPHQHDFVNGYRDEIETQFGPDKRDDAAKNKVARRIVREIATALNSPAKPQPPKRIAVEAPATTTIRLAGHEHRFAHVSAGWGA